MKEINDGGPAFPVAPLVQRDNGEYEFSDPGMTLRDWFAGQALIGVVSQMSNTEIMAATDKIARKRNTSVHDVGVATAYAYADAMIAARGEG